MTPTEIAIAFRTAAELLEKQNQQDALGVGPASPELEKAFLMFRASGGTAAQLTIFARSVAGGRISRRDLDELEVRGIKRPDGA